MVQTDIRNFRITAIKARSVTEQNRTEGYMAKERVLDWKSEDKHYHGGMKRKGRVLNWKTC